MHRIDFDSEEEIKFKLKTLRHAPLHNCKTTKKLYIRSVPFAFCMGYLK